MISVRAVLGGAGLSIAVIGAAIAGCENAQTTAEMLDCGNTSYKAADAELNAVYKEVLATLSPQGQGHLKSAQSAWITVRDKQCEAEAGVWEKGSFAPVAQVNCLSTMTSRRVDDLKRLMPEG